MDDPAVWTCTCGITGEETTDLKVDASIMVLKLTDYDVSYMASPEGKQGREINGAFKFSLRPWSSL